eukprot:4338100-Amphidinium_carterae.1
MNNQGMVILWRAPRRPPHVQRTPHRNGDDSSSHGVSSSPHEGAEGKPPQSKSRPFLRSLQCCQEDNQQKETQQDKGMFTMPSHIFFDAT